MDWKLGKMEARFAELIWRNAPISSGELVKLCQRELEWKKSTTYTMLRRLCQRGIFENREGTVVSLLTREEVLAQQSESFLEETFQGSLPQFLAAFTARKPLTEEEIRELEALIRRSSEGRESR
ncbi:MAG: BlaI/MecI/CopY family transcriptional regulator [Angelakisella sp.]|jgi:predicted transcriptional regulator|nr:BlaI/MecI/CopY family transcriptional regulator [Angelakisella sp.]